MAAPSGSGGVEVLLNTLQVSIVCVFACAQGYIGLCSLTFHALERTTGNSCRRYEERFPCVKLGLQMTVGGFKAPWKVLGGVTQGFAIFAKQQTLDVVFLKYVW